MKRLMLALATLFLLSLACSAMPALQPSAPPNRNLQSPPTQAADTLPALTAEIPAFQPGDPFPAQIEADRQAIVSRLFESECLEVVTTPLVVEAYIIFGVNKRDPKPGESDPNNCADDPLQSGVFAVSAVSGEAYALLLDFDVEGTPAYADGRLIVPLVSNGGGVFWWQDGRGQQMRPLKTSTDSAGLWDDELNAYIVGSVNTPIPLCQNGPNPDCGALIAVSPDGDVLHRLDRASSLRGWTTGGPTGDGEFFYFGNGAGTDGDSEPSGNPLNACSVIKIDRDFNILATYDDGAAGCTDIGRLESAVVGEIPVVDGVLWAQYLGSTDGSPAAPVVRLNAADLTPLCRAELPIIPDRTAALFYQAPVVDELGNAYVVAANPENGMNVSLYRIAPDCSLTRLYDTASTRASTPSLADDRWVLLAEAGTLHLVDRQSGATQDIPLPADEDVRAGVVVSAYGVHLVTQYGTVITLTDTGVQGYGAAPWPRFRRDNYGSGH